MLPGFRPFNRQQMLFEPERPITGHGSVRYQVGEFFEDLAVRFFGAQRFKTDGRVDYCPDLLLPPYYIENKGVGKNGQVFIYAGRLEKDSAFARTHPLVYLVWHHGAETVQAQNDLHLRYLLASKLRACFAVPFNEIEALCRSRKPVKLNSKYGHCGENPTYGEGYRFPISLLFPFALLWFNDYCG